MAEARPLPVRLREYRDTLLSMADQIEAILALADKGPTPTAEQAEARAGLRACVDLYRIIAGEDLTNILAGTELSTFVIYQKEQPGG